jgi:hypothetical protein
MKKLKFARWALTVASIGLCVLAMGCATTISVEKQYPERWEITYEGMTIEEFKRVWPEASYAGVGQNGGEIYTVASRKLYSGMSIEYFIFDTENKLEKWRESNYGSVEK